MNKKQFYDHIRPRLFKGGIGNRQFQGMEYILSEWGETGFTDYRWLTYALATTYHETARTMQPIKEKGGKAYFMRMYDKSGNRPHVARRLGNTQVGDGAKFCGRGYVQLTGRTNYGRASRALGIDFVASPARVMEPDLAAFIMFTGMKQGWFTGKSFRTYIRGDVCDYKNARKIINGLDEASTIAGYAEVFDEGLQLAGASVQEPRPVPIPTAPDTQPTTLFGLILTLIRSMFGK